MNNKNTRNRQDIARLLELTDQQVELAGPRGVAHGHDALADWVQRAGLHLTTLRTFARADAVVIAQHGAWRSPETGAIIGEAAAASFFMLHQRRVARIARYDTLGEALQAAQLTADDEQ